MSPDPDDAPQLAPRRIEPARSSRSRCRTCRRKIESGTLRLGVLLEGPYGTGYLWHHLTCAARRAFDEVEAAYAEHAWDEGVQPPPLEELRALREKAEAEREARRQVPYAERAPSGRAKCRHCGEPIAQASLRVALLREVVFGREQRATPILVHPGCVPAAIAAEDCLTEADGFADLLRANSEGLPAADIEEALQQVGPI